MRCLIFNSKEISFGNGEPSDRPTGIRPERSENDLSAFHNIAVAFLCIEANDEDVDAYFITDELLRYSNMVGRKLLIVPFVHLTSDPARPELATRYIKFVSQELRNKELLEGLIGFGYHKALIGRWITLPHKGSVVFRDSKYRKEKYVVPREEASNA